MTPAYPSPAPTQSFGPRPPVFTEYVLDGRVIVWVRHTNLEGKTCNAMGTACRFQTLFEWRQYVNTLYSDSLIEEAWRGLLQLDTWHAFEGEEYNEAKRILAARRPGLEMQLREK